MSVSSDTPRLYILQLKISEQPHELDYTGITECVTEGQLRLTETIFKTANFQHWSTFDLVSFSIDS